MLHNCELMMVWVIQGLSWNDIFIQSRAHDPLFDLGTHNIRESPWHLHSREVTLEWLCKVKEKQCVWGGEHSGGRVLQPQRTWQWPSGLTTESVEYQWLHRGCGEPWARRYWDGEGEEEPVEEGWWTDGLGCERQGHWALSRRWAYLNLKDVDLYSQDMWKPERDLNQPGTVSDLKVF